MIRCRGVEKSFSGKKVLSGIDMDIPEGKIFGLLGPSGAGKTTLIRIITGQLGYDAGSVNIFDRESRELTRDDNKKIGIMMEQELLKQDFLRVSKQSIVNLRKIKSLKADINRKVRLTLTNGEQIVVSRMYADELRRKLGLK